MFYLLQNVGVFVLIKVYNTEVEYDYLFGKGDFCVPDFPLCIETDEEDCIKILHNFAEFSKGRKIDSLFMKNFLYILYNLRIIGNTKKYTKLMKSNGEGYDPQIFLFLKLYDGFKKNRTFDAEINEFIENNLLIFREYSFDLPVLIKEYSTMPLTNLERLYPFYSLRKDNFYKRLMPKNPRTEYAFMAIDSFINVVNKLKSNRVEQLIKFLRASLAYRLGEDNLADFLSVKSILTLDSIKPYINKQDIVSIFKEDYDNTFEHSLVGRLLHMSATATSFSDNSQSVKTENLLEKMLTKSPYISFEGLQKLVTSGAIDPIDFVLSERENARLDKDRIVDLFEVVSHCNNKEKERFSNYLAHKKVTFNNIRLYELEKSAAPITFRAHEEDKNLFSVIFSNKYKSIHNCSSYEFHKDIALLQKEEMRRYISSIII